MASPPPTVGEETQGPASLRGPRTALSEHERWTRYTRYPYLLAKLVFFGLLFAAGYWVITHLEAVVFPIFVSLLVAYLLDPFVDKFEERGISRTTAILVLAGAAGLVLLAFAAVFYPMIGSQISKVSQRAPELLDQVETKLLPWLKHTLKVPVPASASAAFSKYGQQIKAAVPGLIQRLGKISSDALKHTGGALTALINVAMIPLFAFYFLRDFDRMTAYAAQFLPKQNRAHIRTRIGEMDEVVGAWFRGQVQVGLILAVLYSIGLALCFGLGGQGVDAGVAIGILAGVLNIIPYFGFAIGFVLSILIALIDWHGMWPLIGVIVTFSVVQLAEGYLITPIVVGEKVGLNSVTVIIVLLIGGEVGGLMGILLAIPIAGATKVLLPDVIGAYKQSVFYSGKPIRIGGADGTIEDDGVGPPASG